MLKLKLCFQTVSQGLELETDDMVRDCCLLRMHMAEE